MKQSKRFAEVLPIIRLEIGALAAWTPTQEATVTPFAAEQYSQVFRQPSTSLRTVSPEQARNALRIPEEEQKKYSQLLKQ